MRILPLFAVLSVWWILAGHLRAHQVDSVEMEFEVVEDEWRLTGLMDIAFMAPETRGDPDSPPFYREVVMAAPAEKLARMRRETEITLRRILTLSFNGGEVPWRIEFLDFESDPVVLPEEEGGWAFFRTRIVADAEPGPGELRVIWKDDEESELIIVTEGADGAEILSTPAGMSSVLLRVGEDGAVTTEGKAGAAWGWLVSGYRHVIPLGLDHLLFIVGLFLLVPRWKPLLGQSLLFTLAHSITLALAVLGYVSVPERPVEILIAASIAWIGIENLLVKELKPRRLVIVFAFGLLHGLGFAGVLSEKLAGIPGDRLVRPLVWFNVGVELAQVTVLVAAFLLLWPVRKWTRQVRVVGSILVALAGLGWVVERVLG